MTFVFVHGGGNTARSWEPTMSQLAYPSLAIDMPGRGRHPAPLDKVRIDDWVESAVADIKRSGADDIVLVGHSMGGLTVPAIAAELADRVRHVVFISASILGEGATLIQMVDEETRAQVEELKPDPDVQLLPYELLKEMLCYDMDEAQARWFLDLQVPEAYWPTRETPKVLTLDPKVDRTWIRPLRDRTFPPQTQDEMRKRIGCDRTIDIDAGHMVMVSRPAELAKILNDLHH
ncbi:alpha/beta hydrolase [Rhodococcus sp. IEGM 1366]|uniref:alpha/beta fold hydrolase n=1 Tax=Rhodococcus sp. IEGM 1366 TaxID=3082223 RepID=UPI002952B523|nr:alpha/beta hydrolase [Rhodococcus sp. IEGM 1366]MDV8070996.1 alpha/beta hydrolase [Rhodococcus sp. IEGM 1366]